ncbi:fungal-specific transcription factor domain-containing protein [Xylariaceae sp. FL0804]|nr:fungal-specific transcription factor domain-containing protein [Xylariaceae sp. FL0804]
MSPVDLSPQYHPSITSGSPALSTTRDFPPAGPVFVAKGPITLDPSAPPSPALNPRSCVTCRRRKVRCDKHMPCGNCRKAHIQCVFPAPGRAPRRPRVKDPNAPPKQTSEREIELLKRLRKLEGIVEDLSGQIDVDAARHPTSSREDSPEEKEKEPRRNFSTVWSENLPGGYPPPEPPRPYRSQTGDTNSSTVRSPAGDECKDVGRLVLNEKGRTRYVSSAFWAKVNDELNKLRDETQRLTDEESDYSDDGSTPITVHSQAENHVDHHSFILGYRSSDVDLRKLHPLPSQIPFMWQVYTENVDPLVKILHVPTMSKVTRELRSNMDSITPGMEALIFAIYYSAIASMEEQEVTVNFGTDKAHMESRYRFATEQALAKADFLTTSELVVAQAFTLFLLVVRRLDDTRFAWTLTGLAIRIAQSLGLHREGTHFQDLSPFDVEMRRRLWWAICVLDLRSAEDQGTELTIGDRSFDTRQPLNVNDADIDPDMADFPEERRGATEMTFCLVRYEICSLYRRMHTGTDFMHPCLHGESQLSLAERETMLVEMYAHIEEKYLKACENKEGDVMHWVAATIARMIMAKMGLIIYQPMLMPETGEELSADIRDRLFMLSIEVVEYCQVLNCDPRCRAWRWLFEAYTQWHAVAYLMLEVCRRPWSASVERGWMALTATLQRRPDSKQFARPQVLQPLRRLMVKARHHRDQEVARLRADPDAARGLDAMEGGRAPPDSGAQHLPNSVRNAMVQDHWRNLVGFTAGPAAAAAAAATTMRKPSFAITTAAVGAEWPSAAQQQQPPAGGGGEQHQSLSAAQQQQQDSSSYQFVDQVMSAPYFTSTDFFSVAFAGDTPDEMARRNFLAASDQPPPPNVTPPSLGTFTDGFGAGGGLLAFPTTTAGTATMLTSTSRNGGGGSSNNSKEAPMVVGGSAVVDDNNNPPPWLWDNAWGEPALIPDAVDVSGGGGGAQDVNMDLDDDFNWQNWMDSGLAMGRAGFTGGI